MTEGVTQLPRLLRRGGTPAGRAEEMPRRRPKHRASRWAQLGSAGGGRLGRGGGGGACRGGRIQPSLTLRGASSLLGLQWVRKPMSTRNAPL